MLRCRPAGCKQMDPRLNMHGWSSDIVLPAACCGAGLLEPDGGDGEMDSSSFPAPTIRGFLEPSSGSSEKGAISARRRNDSGGMLKRAGCTGILGKREGKTGTWWWAEGEVGGGKDGQAWAFCWPGPVFDGPIGFLAPGFGAGILAGLWARFLVSAAGEASVLAYTKRARRVGVGDSTEPGLGRVMALRDAPSRWPGPASARQWLQQPEMRAQSWALGSLVCKSGAPSDDSAMLGRWTQVPAAPPPPSLLASLSSLHPRMISRGGRNAREIHCYIMITRLQLVEPRAEAVTERKNLWKVTMCLGLGLRARFHCGFPLSHRHPGFHWMHKGTPIRRRGMWERTHGGGGVCPGGF